MSTQNHLPGYTEDPLSPFSVSQCSTAPISTSQAKKPLPQSHLDFMDKVTDKSGGDFYWAKPVKGTDGLSASEKMAGAIKALTEAKRRQRVKEEFSHFCDETSFTALVRIYNASSWMRRIGWIVVFLTMLVWLTIQCYWLLDKYFSFPMEVKLDLEASRTLDFPSVTVCNLNPIKNHAMMDDPQFDTLVQYANEIEEDDMLYDFYYDNYDWLYSSSTPFWSTTQSLHGSSSTTPGGPTQSPGPATTTTNAPGPGATTSTAGPATTTKATATSSTSPPTTTKSIPSPGRKKRGIGESEETRASNSHAHAIMDTISQAREAKRQHTADANFRETNVQNSIKFESKDNKYPDEVDFEALKRDIFGEEGIDLDSLDPEKSSKYTRGRREERHVRIRRSPKGMEERHEMMKNNSFNKWEALDNTNLNTSYYYTRGTEYKAAMTYATLTADMDPQKVKLSGHKINDLLLTCRFNGWLCSPSNFSYFHNHKYGNCYTFNGQDSIHQAQTKFPGPDFGLTLEMYIQQDQYVPALAAEAGVRVLVHPKGSAPFPEDDGISIPPGHSSSISMRMVDILRLEPPHGTCDYDGSTSDMYASTQNTTYSKLSCLKSCYQTIANRHCNCSLPMYIISDGYSVCDMANEEVDMCTSSLPEKVPDEYTDCDLQCPQPCAERDYDMLVSSAAWPSQMYEGYLQTKVQQSNYLLMDHTSGNDDFVKLNVYFTDLMVQKIEQQKAYESQNLISDIGGQLGLWLGLSAITIGELCGLILSLFRSATSTPANHEQDKNRTSTPVHPFNDLSPNMAAKERSDVTLSDVKTKGFV